VTIVTGSNTGIGLETARRIAENGATVVLACRSLERGEAAKRDIEAHLAQCSSSSSPSSGKSPFADSGKVLVRKLDLADLDSVKSFADSFLEEFPRCEYDV
jgi:NAD(P)-dependent dehydrogenase (short-subunit alcohol dehydrogenase family)